MSGTELTPLTASGTDYGGLNAQIRGAYQAGDVESSKMAHEMKKGFAVNDEHHATESGENLKSLVYGGLDGIITTFATVTSVAGAKLSPDVILIIGIAHLFADAVSMGMGDYLSSQAEIDYNLAERKREQWEMDNNMPGEIEEMVEIYMARGMGEADARSILNTLAKYPKIFLDNMMVQELNLMPIEEDESPLMSGIVTALSFMVFGCVPLLSYLFNFIPGCAMTEEHQFNVACILTLFTLFLLGAVKGSLTEAGQKWYVSGVYMAVNGAAAASVGYIVGALMKEIFNVY